MLRYCTYNTGIHIDKNSIIYLYMYVLYGIYNAYYISPVLENAFQSVDPTY